MPRRVIISVVTVLLAIGSAAWLCGLGARPNTRSAARVKWYDFNRDSVRVMNDAGFGVIALTSFGDEILPVPLSARFFVVVPPRKNLTSSERD